MSSLGVKLARLGPPSPRPLERGGAEPSLEQLRRRLAAMTGRAVPARTPTCRLRREPLEVRMERYPFAHRVGACSVGRARTASAEMLSLLALTPALASCAPERALFLDTETTGFGTGTGNLAFLVGLSWFDEDGSLVLEQLFLRDPSAEAELLERVRTRLGAAELVVSYNGKAFDLPVLAGRCVMNRLPPLPARPQLDLLHVARRVHRHRRWQKRLSRLEREVLGYRRGHDVSGEEVAQRYLHYLRSGALDGMDEVLEHNARDVLTLSALTGLYGEPLPARGLPAAELASVARVARRAGDLARAAELAELAVSRGAGAEGLRVRAEVAKARGDKERALADFEALAEQVADPDVRLELAKLYEHHLKRPARALALARLGTGETPRAWRRRCARLERKLAADKPWPGAG